MSFANVIETLLLKQPPKPIVEKKNQFRAGFVASVKQVGDSNRTFRFIASTESTDRYGDSIKANGWNLDSFRKNPVFLWSHRSQDPPIGKVVNVGIENKALLADVEFCDPADYPFAGVIASMYRKGFLSAVSVGFRPLAAPVPNIDEESGNFVGYNFTSQELLELSAVPVPANPEALQAAYKTLGTEASIRKFWGESNMPWAYSVPGVTHAIAIGKSDPPAADPMQSDPDSGEDADPNAGADYESMSLDQLETKSRELLAVIGARKKTQAAADFEKLLLVSKN